VEDRREPIHQSQLRHDDVLAASDTRNQWCLTDCGQGEAERAKLPSGVRPYDLRHTRLTRWAASHPLPLVQKAAGHASIKTTMGYVHLQDEDLNALVVSAPKPNEKAG
jgi:integrase